MPREDNKGYGNSQVLMRDYTTLEDCETVLSEIADQVATRLRKHEVQGEVVGISVGFAEPDASGQTHWGAQVHIDPTNRTDDLIRAVKYLFESKWQGDALRNVGVRVNKISHPSSFQLSLFEPSQREQANGRLEHAIDQIRSRYGYKAIVRGSSKTAGGTAIDRAGMIGGHQA